MKNFNTLPLEQLLRLEKQTHNIVVGHSRKLDKIRKAIANKRNNNESQRDPATSR